MPAVEQRSKIAIRLKLNPEIMGFIEQRCEMRPIDPTEKRGGGDRVVLFAPRLSFSKIRSSVVLPQPGAGLRSTRRGVCMNCS